MAPFPQSLRVWIMALATGTVATWMETAPSRAQPARPPRQDAGVGLSVNDSRAYQGYSLVAPMNSTATYLIDMEGRVVHTWQSDCAPALSAYLLDDGHLLRAGSLRTGSFGGPGAGGRIQKFSWDGELVWDYKLSTERHHPHHDICPLPNGNVLVIAWDRKTPADAVAAGRHPDTVRGQFLSDSILEVRPTGKTTGEIVWQWHAWDHLIQDLDRSKPNYGEVADHPELIDVNYGTGIMAAMLADPESLAKLRSLGYVGGGNTGPDGDRRAQGGPGTDSGSRRRDRGGPGPGGGPPTEPDWMHTNSVAYNPKLDQVMLSIHGFSEVWIIDHSTTTAEAASHRGGRYGQGGDLLYRWGNPRAYRNGTHVDQRLFSQHDAHWIAEGLPGAGHMLVFNNGNGRPDGMYSSVDEVVLPVQEHGHYSREEYLAFGPDRADWSYAAPDRSSFFSMNISGAQRLPNGNTLICSGAAGILFEVTPDQEVVWRYAVPGIMPGGFGPPGGPFAFSPPRPGEVLPSMITQALELSQEQIKKLAQLQTEVDARLAQILTEDQRDQLARMQRGMPGGPGFGPPGFGLPGFGPPAFGGPGWGLPGTGLPALGLPGFGAPGSGARTAPASGPGDAASTGPPSAGAGPDRASRIRPGGPDSRGPAGGPGGRGGQLGGPGGIFTCDRYGADYPGLVGKDLTPGKKLDLLLIEQARPGESRRPGGPPQLPVNEDP